jgi:hypothetical protein
MTPKISRVVGAVLAVLLLGAGVAEHFRHGEQPSSRPTVTQPATPAPDEPRDGAFNGPPNERRAVREGTETAANVLHDALGESQSRATYTQPFMALLLLGGIITMWLVAWRGRRGVYARHARRVLLP